MSSGGELSHPGLEPNFNDKTRDNLAHVEKTLGFSPSPSIKRRQPLRFSLETQNVAEPCPTKERVAIDGGEDTGVTGAPPATM